MIVSLSSYIIPCLFWLIGTFKDMPVSPAAKANYRPNNDFRAIAVEQIKVHENFKAIPYKDIDGKFAIGFGHKKYALPSMKPISYAKAINLLYDDLEQAVKDARAFYPKFDSDLGELRKALVVNLAYNLGLTNLLQFRKLRECLSKKDFEGAAHSLEDSLWYKQTGDRAKEIVFAMRHGRLPKSFYLRKHDRPRNTSPQSAPL